ncbi:flagellar hook-length control protein FliK, partial [Paraburkholderia sp. 1N]
VDADLTLTGTRLIARVQASPGGAARLAAQGENFRQRLAAAGIELSGLTIREIGGGAPVTAASAAGAAAAGQAAASAYARSASAASAADKASAGRLTTRVARPGTAPLDDFDWDM